MINIRLKQVNIIFRFGFFASLTLLILLYESVYAVFGMYACLLHELGHLAAMKRLKVPVRCVTFYSAGIRIEPGVRSEIIPFLENLLILISGVLTNIAAASVSLFIFHVTKDESAWIFCGVNLVIGAFNLLPLSMFDGGRIIGVLVNRFSAVEKAEENETFWRKCDCGLIVITAAVFFILGNRNLSLYITLFYLMISEYCNTEARTTKHL